MFSNKNIEDLNTMACSYFQQNKNTTSICKHCWTNGNCRSVRNKETRNSMDVITAHCPLWNLAWYELFTKDHEFEGPSSCRLEQPHSWYLKTNSRTGKIFSWSYTTPSLFIVFFKSDRSLSWAAKLLEQLK